MVSGSRSRICSPQPPALLDPRMTPVNAVLVFPGVAGDNNSLGDVRQRSLSQPVTRSWPSSQLCHGDVAEWQTRTVQVRVSERTWGFNSPHPHESRGALCSRKARTGASRHIRSGGRAPGSPASRGWALVAFVTLNPLGVLWLMWDMSPIQVQLGKARSPPTLVSGRFVSEACATALAGGRGGGLGVCGGVAETGKMSGRGRLAAGFL